MAGRPRTRSDEEIFEAVLRAAADAGPGGVTLVDIARQAGLAPSSLVERFGSKRALLLAAGRTATGSVDAAFAAAEAEQDSALDALAAGLVRLSSGVSTRTSLARQLGALQLDIVDGDFRRLAARHAAAMRTRIAALLERAREHGVLRRETDVARLAQTVQVVYNGALISWGIAGRGSLADALRGELEAVLAPLRTTPRPVRSPAARPVPPA
jgi:AcrR family transcriptional regulator